MVRLIDAPVMEFTIMTEFQSKVLKSIMDYPGDDPAFMAMCLGTTSQAFGRAAHHLMSMDIVYYSDAFSTHREWWPTRRRRG